MINLVIQTKTSIFAYKINIDHYEQCIKSKN